MLSKWKILKLAEMTLTGIFWWTLILYSSPIHPTKKSKKKKVKRSKKQLSTFKFFSLINSTAI